MTRFQCIPSGSLKCKMTIIRLEMTDTKQKSRHPNKIKSLSKATH